jgi:hypothetical protein
MTMTCILVAHTNYELVYQCTADGGGSGDSSTIPNAGGATPDLDTDANLQPIATALAQAAGDADTARRFLASAGISGNVLTPDLLPRMHMRVMAIDTTRVWGIDFTATAFKMRPIIQSRETSSGTGIGSALVYINVVHSIEK